MQNRGLKVAPWWSMTVKKPVVQALMPLIGMSEQGLV
jgi:hypothetical protein